MFNKELLTQKNNVAIALSGGKDSMALLHFGLSLGIKKAINVEHGIRGEDSLLDTEFVKKYCKENGVELLCFSVNALDYSKQNKLSIETGARLIRKQCFEKAISLGFCEYVATAHHELDNCETILFNIFRGASIRGGSGMDEQNGYLIRPLLKASRQEIDEYIEKNNIPFRTDSTNFDNDYTRNYLRNEIIPKIKNIFPNFESSLSRFADNCKIIDEYITCERDKYLIKKKNEVKILPCDKAITNACIIEGLKHLGLTVDYEFKHTLEIEKLLNAKNSTTIDLPKNIKAVKDYDGITLFIDNKKQEDFLCFFIGEKQCFGRKIIVKKGENIQKGAFDLDKLPKNCVFRYRLDNDDFTPCNSVRKKLSKYLSDKKIPLRERDNLVVLASGSEVFAIVGVEISDKIKVENKSKIYILGEENV